MGFSLYLYLSLSSLYLFISTLSTILPYVFMMVSLSLVLILFSLYPSTLFGPRDAVWTQLDRVLWTSEGKGNDN